MSSNKRPSNKAVKKATVEVYGDLCMLTMLREKVMTFHHIEKLEDGGKGTIENGAILIDEIHKWLHNRIERNDPELFYLINECLQLYKQCLLQNKEELIELYQQEVVQEYRSRLKRYQMRKHK